MTSLIGTRCKDLFRLIWTQRLLLVSSDEYNRVGIRKCSKLCMNCCDWSSYYKALHYRWGQPTENTMPMTRCPAIILYQMFCGQNISWRQEFFANKTMLTTVYKFDVWRLSKTPQQQTKTLLSVGIGLPISQLLALYSYAILSLHVSL